MFLNDFFGTEYGRNMNKHHRQSTTYNAFYLYWREQLYERVMRLFVWEGTDKGKDPIKPKEIEKRLLLRGHCGVTRFSASTANYQADNKLAVMFGSFYGVTEYYDEWTNYTVRCPIYSGQRRIGKDVVVIDNNSIRNAIYPLIHHYATIMAHSEVTLINALVNARDAGGVPVVTTEKQKQSVNEYLTKLYNGQYGTVTDIGSLGIEYAGTDRKTGQTLHEIIEIREKILKSFYSDIGVRSAFEKRNNTVQAEVEADTSLLLLNLADMIACRQKGCEQVNKMFGTNWSVHVAEEIDYGAENERMQFDTGTIIHVQPGYQDGSSTTGGNENVGLQKDS